ncbi:endospore germination permease [Paenibacillus sp. 1781tsa1]|uniref:GerAB/ArcD/ProY family transporter n=1 Tax=Paenibacillus sp. 1781tsa1 TaxID=2953810 RepID=UPI00209F4721|nr:endospore germination permease [Paenibacillus sp. 1781tsa1]MCP1182083.1 endospore germination permease [Paenibacillus sp. 1781tsa1]
MLIKEKITIRQFALLTFLVMVGDMILLYPSVVTASGKQDSWFCSLIGQPIGLLIIWVLYKLHQTHPDLSLIEICQKILGRWAGAVLSSAYLFYFAIGAAICIREVGDFMTTQIYLQTPIRVILIILMCALVWGVMHGLNTISASSELLTPIVVTFMILLFMGLIPKVNISHLQPYLNTPWLQLIQSTIKGAFTSFGELIVITMVLPYVMSGPHIKRDMLLATLCGGLLLTTLLLISLMIFGPFVTQHDIYISYTLSQKINIGNFFERIEAFMATAWLIATYFKSLLYMFSFVIGTAQLFQLKTYKPLILPSAMLLFALAVLISPNVIFYTNTIMPAWVDWDITVSFIIPLFLLLVHRLRSRKSKNNSTNHKRLST